MNATTLKAVIEALGGKDKVRKIIYGSRQELTLDYRLPDTWGIEYQGEGGYVWVRSIMRAVYVKPEDVYDSGFKKPTINNDFPVKSFVPIDQITLVEGEDPDGLLEQYNDDTRLATKIEFFGKNGTNFV